MGKGGFIKDAMILFVITLVAGVGLGGVYGATKEPIAIANEKARQEAYRAVLSDADEFVEIDGISDVIAGSAEALSGAGFGKVQVDGAVQAMKGADPVGYVISTTSKDGFNGTVSIAVGFDKEGKVTKLEYLTLAETPGLGMNAEKPDFKDQFNGMSVSAFDVTKNGDGAGSDELIDAMSGATITSRAVTGAVNAAIYFKDNYLQ